MSAADILSETSVQAVIAPAHPFYPLAIIFKPDYVPNTLHPITLLLIFFGFLAAWLVAVRAVVVYRTSGKASRADVGWALWFGACAAIHLSFEGYFAFTARMMPQSTSVRSQMWKMYSLSDSRYITADTFTVLMEGCTAVFWGPLSLALALHLIPSRSSFRHPTQLAVSLGQLYGLVLYWGIPIIDEALKGPIAAVSRPGAIFYWGEFVGLNAPWFFIPIWAIYLSTQATAKAFQLEAAHAAGSSSTSVGAGSGRKDDDEGLPFIGDEERRYE